MPYNRPVAYHLRQQDVTGMWSGRVVRVEAGRMIYLSCRDRVSQIREMSPSVSSLARVDAIDQLLEAAIKKEQVQACFGAAITTDAGRCGTRAGAGRPFSRAGGSALSDRIPGAGDAQASAAGGEDRVDRRRRG